MCAGHASCAPRGLAPPRGVSAKLPVYCEVELLDFQPVKARVTAHFQPSASFVGRTPEAHTPRLLCAQVVTDQGGLVTKRILREGNGLETPHSPYEARAHTLLARALSGPVSRRLQSASEAKYGTPACIAPGRLS